MSIINKPTLMLVATLAVSGAQAQTDWPVYGHDPGGMRYSPLSQINEMNVVQLRRAWTYHSRPVLPENPENGPAGGRPPRLPQSEATPLVVDDVMYVTTPYNSVVALEPETGREIWKFEVKHATPGLRGVAYWPGDKTTSPRLLFGTSDGRLMALNAKTGKPAYGFGNEGQIDLHSGVADDYPNALYDVRSPPAIYKDLAITGARMQETPSKGPRGDIRAWDIHTGKLVWTFHTVPQPGEAGHDSWEDDSWKDRSGVNVWGLFTVDTERGTVFLPLGAASYDFYGADRKGSNLYSDALVALDSNTGKVRWYFQSVHHDIWDYDLSGAPALITVRHGDQSIPAVVQVTKTGFVFILDARDGKPIYGVEERPAPPSDVPGESAAATQPFPIKPPPLARISMRPDEIANVTPEHHAFCKEMFDADGGLHNNGPFTPYGTQPTVVFPGTLGGANWGGVSFDPILGYIFVNTQDLGGIGQIVKQPEGSRTPYSRTSAQGPYGRFWDPKTFWPCQQPPWGRLTAVNANTGDIAWQVPLGITEELEAKGLQKTGALNLGGSIATAGRLVFIAATNDSRFRAFDSRSGKELWTTKLEASAHATPITFQGHDGKQYVVIAATGGDVFDHAKADSIIAFALP